MNPKVVLASITGYGQTGPEAHEGAYDTVIQGTLQGDRPRRAHRRPPLRLPGRPGPGIRHAAAGSRGGLAKHTVDELVEMLQSAGVACGRINSLGQAVEDAQTYARNMVVDCEGLRLIGNPIKMTTANDPTTRVPAPALDADGAALRTAS
jgi:crotonobetainyl-CoA:carnitine CoA-transferase CaiB-like acyl-CoA transferase